MAEKEDEKGPMATLFVVLMWFFLNVAMASSTKWLYIHGVVCTTDFGHVEARLHEPNLRLLREMNLTNSTIAATEVCRSYKFPLAITVLHMAFSWTTCRLFMTLVRGTDLSQGLSWSHQARTIAPLAMVFALSVSMGNLSLKYIFPSFNQMLGSMGPLVTVIMAILMEGKRYNCATWVSMPVLCGGLGICSLKEANFHMLGGLFATGATILRSVKSIMQGKILSGKEKLDAVALLYYMAPWAAGLLTVMSLIMEGTEPFTILMGGLLAGPMEVVTGVPKVIALLCFSGMNACLLNIFNFLVTFYTNAVWQQVLGNVKSCMSIAASVYIFGNELKPEQAIGVATCLIGVWMFNKWGGVVKKDPTPAASLEDGKPARELDSFPSKPMPIGREASG